MTEKKPDLSDLKARLGLTKPGSAPPGVAAPPGAGPSPAAPAAPPASSPAPNAAPAAFAPPGARPLAAPSAAPAPGPSPAPMASPPIAAAPPAAAPPIAAPPAAAQAPRPKRQKEEYVPQATAPLDIDIHSMDTAPAFSKGTIVIFGVCLVLGLVFGYAAATTMFQREISSARVADATELRESFGKRIAAFNEVLPKIMAMSDTNVDFAGAEALSKAEFAAGGNQLAKNRLLLGQVAIDNVTSYATDSQLLGAMIVEHNRLTNSVDKEELEQLVAENKILENDYFGVVFDYKHALKTGGDADYKPKEGTLIVYLGEGSEPGKAKVEYPATGNEAEVEFAGLIPISKTQILKSGGQNAMTRYQWRVRQIKFQADKVSKYAENVLTSLDAVAAE